MLVIDIDNRYGYHAKNSKSALRLIKAEKLEQGFLTFTGRSAMKKALTLEEMSDTWHNRNPDTKRVFANENEAADWVWQDHKEFPAFQKKHLFIPFTPPSTGEVADAPVTFRTASLQKGEVVLVVGTGTARSGPAKALREEAEEWGELGWEEAMEIFNGDAKITAKAVRRAVKRNVLMVKPV